MNLRFPKPPEKNHANIPRTELFVSNQRTPKSFESNAHQRWQAACSTNKANQPFRIFGQEQALFCTVCKGRDHSPRNSFSVFESSIVCRRFKSVADSMPII